MSIKFSNHLFIVVIGFVLSRLMYYALGVNFDWTPLMGYKSFIDIELLTNRLFESTYYLHFQLPAFNLFLGAILKLFPNHYILVFYSIYLALGLTMSITLLHILQKLNVSPRLSAILTIVFINNPAVVMYENWLYLTYPIAALLCLAALFLHKFIEQEKLADGFIFFLLLMMLALIKNLFHGSWVLFFFLLIFFQKKSLRKKLFLAFILPFLIILAVYIKNSIIFGIPFGSSSISGYHLAQMTIHQLSRERCSDLYREGKISAISCNRILREELMPIYRKNHAPVPQTGIPVLDQDTKSDGAANYNSMTFIPILKEYGKDARYVLRNYPETYFQALTRAYFVYFFPGPTEITFPYRERINGIEHLYNPLFYFLSKSYPIYSITLNFSIKPPHQVIKWNGLNLSMYILVVLFYIALILFGLRLVIKSFKKNPVNKAFALTIFFIWFNIVYVTLCVNALACHGNNRYRFAIDPFYWIILSLLINNLMTYGKRRLSRKSQKVLTSPNL